MTEKRNLELIVLQVEATVKLASSLLGVNHPAHTILSTTEASLKLLVGGSTTETPTTSTTQAPRVAPGARRNAVDPTPDGGDEGDLGRLLDAEAEAFFDQHNDEQDDQEGRERTVADALNDGEPVGGVPANQFNQVLTETPDNVAEVVRNAENPDDVSVVGAVEINGETVEVGDWEGNMARMDEVLEAIEVAREDEGEDPLPEPAKAMLVQYTRLDNGELTENDVVTIFDHPHSAPLRRLGGGLTLTRVLPGDAQNIKIAQIEINDADRNALTALALGAMSYVGIKVFPSVGRVEARGSVNFEL